MVADSRFCMWQGMAPGGAKADPLNTPADRDFHAGKMPHVTRLQRNEAGELVKVQPACFSQRLGADENFEGMAGKIRFAGAAKSTTEPAKSVATSTSETNLRQQVGEMVKLMGAEKAADYVNRGFTLGEALEAELKSREAEKAQLTATVAAKDAADKKREYQDAVGKSLREINDDLKQLKAEANGEKPTRKGFAGKLRFGGGFNAFGSKHTQKGNN